MLNIDGRPVIYSGKERNGREKLLEYEPSQMQIVIDNRQSLTELN